MHRYHGKFLHYPRPEHYEKDDYKIAWQQFLAALPIRQHFIDEPAQKALISDLKAHKEVLFLPNGIYDMNIRVGNQLKYMMYMIGIVRDGSKAVVELTDYEPWFDVRVPPGISPTAFIALLTDLSKSEGWFVSRYQNVLQRPGKLLHVNEVPYIRLVFQNLIGRKKALATLAKPVNYYNSITKEYADILVETASDEASNYFRTVSRELELPLTKWIVLKDYELLQPVKEDGTADSVPHVLGINPQASPGLAKRNVKFQFRVNYKSAKAYDADYTNVPDLIKDRSMVMSWDIETHPIKFTGDAPQIDRVFTPDGSADDITTMISTTFHWYYTNEPLLTVGFTDLPQPPRSDCLIIQVTDQTDLFKIKALLIERMAPEWVDGFNDGRYDWPFLLRRMEAYDDQKGTNLMDWFRRKSSVLPATEANKWNIRGSASHSIKMEAGVNIDIETWEVPNYIPIDVRVIFQQLYPKAEQSSLKFFLDKEKLGSKEDMPYITMFRIYRVIRQIAHMIGSDDYETIVAHVKNDWMAQFGPDGYPLSKEVLEDNPFKRLDASNFNLETFTTSEILKLVEMSSQVLHYCNIDAQRCQDLLKRRNIIADKRETAALSFVSFYDAVFFAGGMKVRNNVLSLATKADWQLAFSNKSAGDRKKDLRKYPGAYVMFPRQGFHRDHRYVKVARLLQTYHPDILKLHLPELTDGLQQKYLIPKESSFVKNIHPITLAVQSRVQELYDLAKIPVHVVDLGQVNEQIQGLDDAMRIMYDRVKKGFNLNRQQLDEIQRNNDVFPQSDEGCSGLDFSSLYPNIIINYNFSPEMCVKDPELVKQLEGKLNRWGKPYRFVEVQFHYKLPSQAKHPSQLVRAWFMQYDVEIVDGKPKYLGMGIYPHILKRIFDMRAALKGNLEWHSHAKEFLGKVIDDRKKAKLPPIDSLPIKEQLQTVLDLARKNWQTKQAEFLKTKKEVHGAWAHAAKVAVQYIWKEWICVPEKLTDEQLLSNPIPDVNPLTLSKFFDDYVSYYWNYYNSKQLALKVFMNTFYGETGNNLSPFFIVEVAGAVTYMGQQEIKWVRKQVTDWGFDVVYGDTDSLYTKPRAQHFKDINEEFESGKISLIEYWQKKIDRCMEVMNNCRDRVNAALKARHGGKVFLKMAYEEVLFPFALFGKKKYIGIKHEGLCNLSGVMPGITVDEFSKCRELFVRGLELIKRGGSELMRTCCYMVLRDVFNVTEIRTLRQVTEDKLQEVSATNWPAKLFSRSAKYKERGRKPDGTLKRGNPTVQDFMARMKEVYENHPEFGIRPKDLGERYEYVIARKYPYKYDVRGRKKEISVADRCEYAELVTSPNPAYEEYLGGKIVPDTDYYFTHEICGQFGRFLVYHPEFNPDYNQVLTSVDPDQLEDKLKEMDKTAVDKATSYLVDMFTTRFGSKYPEYGPVLKDSYRLIEAKKLREWTQTYGPKASLLRLTVNAMSMASDNQHLGSLTPANFLEMLDTLAEKKAAKIEVPDLFETYKYLNISTSSLYTIQHKLAKEEQARDLVRQKVIEANLKQVWNELQNVAGKELTSMDTWMKSIYAWVNPSNEPQDELMPKMNDELLDYVLSQRQTNESNIEAGDVLDRLDDCLEDLVAMKLSRRRRHVWITAVRDKLDREVAKSRTPAGPSRVVRTEMRNTNTAEEVRQYLASISVGRDLSI